MRQMVGLCALLLSMTSTSWASASPESAAAADALFKAGIQLAEEGKFAESLVKLRASYEIAPARGTLQAMAMAEEARGRTASAMAIYRKLLTQAQTAGDEERRRFAANKIRGLEPRLSAVIIVAKGLPPGSRIRLGETWVPSGAYETALPVDPGSVSVMLEVDGKKDSEQSVEVEEGETQRVVVTPKGTRPIAPPPGEEGEADKSPTSWSTQRTASAISAGAGVVLLGLGTFFFIDGSAQKSDVDDQCPDTVCPTQALIDEGESAQQKRTLGAVAAVVGAAAVGVGAYFFFTDSKNSSAGVRAAPGGAQAFARLRF